MGVTVAQGMKSLGIHEGGRYFIKVGLIPLPLGPFALSLVMDVMSPLLALPFFQLLHRKQNELTLQLASC